MTAGLTDYFVCYNTERRHQSLNDVTPDEVYRTASGGGARIVDQFGETETTPPETKKETENLGSAVPLRVNGYPLKLNALLS
jgi:putative transposase